MSRERHCEWQSPHPAPVDRVARRLALIATGVRYDVPPGCYVRAACRRIYAENCPADAIVARFPSEGTTDG